MKAKPSPTEADASARVGDCAQMPPEIEELLAASEALYHATLAEIRAGRTLPPDAESPSHIAFSVVMLALERRIECPAWARNQVLRSWARFENFERASVGEAFEIPETKHAHARRAERLCAAVYHRVRELKAQNVPQQDSAKRKGSLSIVGDEFHMSPGQVKQRMAEWMSLCRAAGKDPDAGLEIADAQAAIAQTIGHTLAPASKSKK